MGFLSGLTANGLPGAVGRMTGGAGGFFSPAGPALRPGGRDLLDRLRTAMDPERLAMAQALLAGDYGAVSRITEPLRRRRLAARAQASKGNVSKKGQGLTFGSSDNGNEEYSFDLLADPAVAGPASELPPTAFQSHTLPWPNSPVFRGRSERSGPPNQGREVGEGIVSQTQRAFQHTKPPSPPPDPAAERRIFIEKLRRGGGLNEYGYIPTDAEVNLLTRAAFSEFGEVASWPDLHAGIWSILNRVRPSGGYGRHRYELGPTLREVLNRRDRRGVPQFSFVPRGGIDAPGGSPAWQRSADPESMEPLDRKAWELSLGAVKDVLSGSYPDPTAGASYYHNDDAGLPREMGPWWRSLRRSPYHSRNEENFFYQAPEEPVRPHFDKPSPY